MPIQPSRPVGLLVLATLVLACSGGGGSGSGGEVIEGPELAFTGEGSAWSETSGPVEIQLELSSAATEVVTVPYTVAGSAVAGEDYGLASPNPLVIPIGEARVSILLELEDDGVAFGPIAIEIGLGPPTGATLGTPAAYVLTVLDDEVAVPEVEPNDNVVLASSNGSFASLAPQSILSLGGQVTESQDTFDVFRLQVPPSVGPLNVSATLIGPPQDMLVGITTLQGLPLGPLDGDSVAFEVPAGPLLVVVQATGASPMTYQVRIEADALP